MNATVERAEDTLDGIRATLNPLHVTLLRLRNYGIDNLGEKDQKLVAEFAQQTLDSLVDLMSDLTGKQERIIADNSLSENDIMIAQNGTLNRVNQGT